MFWYRHLLELSSVCCDLHSIVSVAEVDIFLTFSFFLYGPRNVAVWSLLPLPFLNPGCTSGSSQFMCYWSLAWRILSITLLACEMRATLGYFQQSLALPSFEIGMKTDLFQFWLVECSAFTASSFRVLNNSAGISSFPLALFVVMLPKAHLTSHSRMPRSRWVTTPPWLSRSLRPFLHSCSVYSCHLFLISSASFRSLPFLSFMMPFSAWNVPLISLLLLRDICCCCC